MKKLFKLGVLGLIVAVVPLAQAVQVCQKSDIQCYESGPSQNLSTPFRVDATGNVTTAGGVTMTGNETISGTGTNSNAGSQSIAGRTIYTPLSVTVATTSAISPSATYIMIVSSGGNLVMNGGASTAAGIYPLISTATAVNGQFLVIGTTVSAPGSYSITLTSGTGSALDLGAATRVIGYGKKLGLVFDSANAIWVELFYGSN